MGNLARFGAGAAVLLALLGPACAGEERRPSAPPSQIVSDLRRGAGSGVQDCGEATESKTDTACRVHSVGECLAQALKDCRPAFGMRSYFAAEGDPVRVDWLVLSDGHGGCKVVTVEDKSADPLAKKTPTVKRCSSVGWKHHESIPDCEAPVADGCQDAKPEKPREGSDAEGK